MHHKAILKADEAEDEKKKIANRQKEIFNSKLVMQILIPEVIESKSKAFLDKIHAALSIIFSEKHTNSCSKSKEEESRSPQLEVSFCPPDSLLTILRNGSISNLLIPVSSGAERLTNCSPFLSLREL